MIDELEKWRLKHFSCFARNGKWGTCCDCPKNHGQVYPEFCNNYLRYDHQFTLERLMDQYEVRLTEQS